MFSTSTVYELKLKSMSKRLKNIINVKCTIYDHDMFNLFLIDVSVLCLK